MEKWNSFRIHKNFIKTIKKSENTVFSWPTELNFLNKKFKSLQRSDKNFSIILKLFLKYFYRTFPHNYVFEIRKTKKRLECLFSNKLFFQLPEGMSRFYIKLCNIVKKISRTILATTVSCQITYGACCIQDFLARNFGYLIVFHYGHSCLVSILNCIVLIIYIFVEIKYDFSFLPQSLKRHFCRRNDRIMITSTIQFSSELKQIKTYLAKQFNLLEIPQTKPLSPGELLGCTSFSIKNQSGVIYIGDGRFHVESIFFFNPNIKIIQYNPFTRSLVLLGFKFTDAVSEKENFIEKALFFTKSCNFIFGALGRQGSSKILRIIKFLSTLKKINYSIYTTTELNNNSLNILSGNLSNLWIQLSCPRISLDWANYFKNLVLSPFEFGILTRSTRFNGNYIPMDFYAKAGKFWTSYSTLKNIFVLTKLDNNVLTTKNYNYFKNYI